MACRKLLIVGLQSLGLLYLFTSPTGAVKLTLSPRNTNPDCCGACLVVAAGLAAPCLAVIALEWAVTEGVPRAYDNLVRSRNKKGEEYVKEHFLPWLLNSALKNDPTNSDISKRNLMDSRKVLLVSPKLNPSKRNPFDSRTRGTNNPIKLVDRKAFPSLETKESVQQRINATPTVYYRGGGVTANVENEMYFAIVEPKTGSREEMVYAPNGHWAPRDFVISTPTRIFGVSNVDESLAMWEITEYVWQEAEKKWTKNARGSGFLSANGGFTFNKKTGLQYKVSAKKMIPRSAPGMIMTPLVDPVELSLATEQ